MPWSSNSSASLGPPASPMLEQLLAAYRAQLSRPVEALKKQRNQFQEQQKVLSSLRSTLQELLFQAQLLTLPGAEQRFATRTVQSSHPEVITATAQNAAPLGSASVYVARTASNDVLASARLTKTDPFAPAGTYRFELTATGSTVTVTVTLDGTEDTETALRKIATAVNTTAEVGAVATVIADTATTVRLTLTAKRTGSDAAISFVDIDGMLARLGWDSSLFADPENRTVLTDTTAGYHRARLSELNALLNVNGISVTRQSNTISDLLPGLTLTLLRSHTANEPPATLTTTVDTDGAAAVIQKLLDAYNAALKELNRALTGPFKGDTALRQLLSTLRSLGSQSLGSGPLQTLADIGISAGKDGTLTLTNRQRLAQELSIDSARVAALFTASGGFGERIVAELHDITGSAGTLQMRWNSIGGRLRILDNRIWQLERRLEQQVELYRKEYLHLQQLYSAATAQLGMVNNFATSVAAVWPTLR